jgi:hypothetical protein
MKRLQQAKTLKQKANKQLEALGRRHLRDVRIVRKDMVYVTGMRMGSEDREEVSFMDPVWLSFGRPLIERNVLVVVAGSSSPCCDPMIISVNTGKSARSSFVKAHPPRIHLPIP